MGLDMFAYYRNGGNVRCSGRSLRSVSMDESPVVDVEDVDFQKLETDENFHYWRKHPNLHGWMENLYRYKGGEAEFNCVNLRLTLEDLDELEEAVLNDELPVTFGFFFGESDGSEKEEDLEFIQKARSLIEAGNMVYYSAWY